jgi:hypothetical protein
MSIQNTWHDDVNRRGDSCSTCSYGRYGGDATGSAEQFAAIKYRTNHKTAHQAQVAGAHSSFRRNSSLELMVRRTDHVTA